MIIAIGSDHAGYQLKEVLKLHMEQQGHQVKDLGGFAPEKADYPLVGERVARAVLSGEAEHGVLICGTGLGISISANKLRGIRAAVCSEPYSAKMSREHNNANILAMGARVVGEDLAKMILDSYLQAEFLGGRHGERVDMIDMLEEKYMK